MMIINKNGRAERKFVGVFERGITVLELIIVLVIIGSLAWLVSSNVMCQGPICNYPVSTRHLVNILESAIKMYHIDTGAYPAQLENLLSTSCGVTICYTPGYLDGARKIPFDAWGNEFHYLVPGTEGRDFDIFSYGSDGKPGGEEDAADIYNDIKSIRTDS